MALNTKHFLVVDDEAVSCTTLSEMIMQLGYEVVTASDGKQALSKLEENKIDVVVTDLKMPNLDGIELLKKIKSTKPDIQVIIY